MENTPTLIPAIETPTITARTEARYAAHQQALAAHRCAVESFLRRAAETEAAEDARLADPACGEQERQEIYFARVDRDRWSEDLEQQRPEFRAVLARWDGGRLILRESLTGAFVVDHEVVEVGFRADDEERLPGDEVALWVPVGERIEFQTIREAVEAAVRLPAVAAN
jgi:hypothetical protein